MGVLPANLVSTPQGERIIYSHQGLTYGGLILPVAHIDGNDVLDFFEALKEWMQSENITELRYKAIPYIYASQPSQEDIYALFRMGAQMGECNLSTTIDLRNPGKLNQQQRRHLKSTQGLSLQIGETTDIESFMRMLRECLQERHEASPVHSAAELRLLMSRFPDNIKIFECKLDGEPQAAVCIYDTGRVAHCQYIASTELGRELNLLTPLFVWLIREQYKDREYFDFGTSNEAHGQILNAGLLRQKYSYGGTGTAYMQLTINN